MAGPRQVSARPRVPPDPAALVRSPLCSATAVSRGVPLGGVLDSDRSAIQEGTRRCRSLDGTLCRCPSRGGMVFLRRSRGLAYYPPAQASGYISADGRAQSCLGGLVL